MTTEPDKNNTNTLEDYTDVVRHMRGEESTKGAWGWAGIGVLTGAVVGGIGSLFLKEQTSVQRLAITGIGSVVGAGIAVALKVDNNAQEMDKKAAELLFADKIKASQNAPSDKSIG